MAEYEDVPLFDTPVLESSNSTLHERIGYLEGSLAQLASSNDRAAAIATNYAIRYGLYLTPQSLKRFRDAVAESEH